MFVCIETGFDKEWLAALYWYEIVDFFLNSLNRHSAKRDVFDVSAQLHITPPIQIPIDAHILIA